MDSIRRALESALANYMGCLMTEELVEQIKSRAKAVFDEHGATNWDVKVITHGSIVNIQLDYRDEDAWRF